MRVPVLAVAALLAACAGPAEQVRVAPATTVVGPVTSAVPAGNPLVGGVQVPISQTIGATVAAVPVLGTLTRTLAAADLRATLDGGGPFTLFAATDAAFGRLAPGTVEALLKPENRQTVSRLATLHLVAERLSAADLLRRIAAGGGRATLTSIAGETLTLGLTGNVVTLTDGGGNRSYVETADVRQANGVIHLVNGVLIPRIAAPPR